MSLEESELTIARIEGFLKAFEWLNHKTNHGCTFAVIKLADSSSIDDALVKRFGPSGSRFDIVALDFVEDELLKVLERFLFLFQGPGGDHLVDPRRSFSITHDWGRRDLLEELISQFELLGITRAWRILPGSHSEELREWCFQDDLALGYPGGYVLIHLGVSD